MPDYDFRSLSPTDFERLACDILNEDLGLKLHTFPEGRDEGIDLQQVTDSGHVTIGQCKHYVRSSTSAFLNAVEKETKKPAIKRADSYIFVTSHPLPPAREAKVAKILGISRSNVWGPGRLNRVLREHDEIERRHFKLWLPSTTVLSELLNAGPWARTHARLADFARRAQYWVDVPAYEHVRDIIVNEGTCIISGAAGVGKTFLAERLMLEALKDGWQAVYIANDLDAAWATSRTTQKHFFFYDDFLGQAELKHDAADKSSDLIDFISYVRENKADKRLVMTTREQVLTQAGQAKSDRLRVIASDFARYTVAISELEAAYRAEILVNHLYFSDLPTIEREKLSVDTRMSAIIRSRSFNPRLVESVTKQSLAHSTADAVIADLTAALTNPAKVWEVTFEVLSDLAKEIILTLATFPDRPIRYGDLRQVVTSEKSVLNWQQAFKSLEPTWIKLAGSGRDRSVKFANPGCRDYILGRLDDDDLAEDRVYNSIERFEQLVALSQSACLLTVESSFQPPVGRKKLATALLGRRAELSVLIGEYWESWAKRSERSLRQKLLRLRDAAALSVIYGSPYTCTWLMQRIEGLIRGSHNLPCAETLALARQLRQIPVETETDRNHLVSRLIIVALGSARNLRDLDAYEGLPDELRVPDVHEVARASAIRILGSELASLLDDDTDPESIEESVRELHQRSLWYGNELDIDSVLDRLDDLARGESSRHKSDPMVFGIGYGEITGILSRLADE